MIFLSSIGLAVGVLLCTGVLRLGWPRLPEDERVRLRDQMVDPPGGSGARGITGSSSAARTGRLSGHGRSRAPSSTTSGDAGLPKIRLHDLRHTHATLALEAGVHPKVVQERLGHATIAITLDTYSHAIPAMQEDAAARIAALLER